jgi:hypothetical protein
MFGAHQPVGRRAQRMRTAHRGGNIAFPVSHINETCGGQRGGHFGHPFIAFRPARALDEARTLALGVLELPCPYPGVDDAQRLTLRGVTT